MGESWAIASAGGRLGWASAADGRAAIGGWRLAVVCAVQGPAPPPEKAKRKQALDTTRGRLLPLLIRAARARCGRRSEPKPGLLECQSAGQASPGDLSWTGTAAPPPAVAPQAVPGAWWSVNRVCVHCTLCAVRYVTAARTHTTQPKAPCCSVLRHKAPCCAVLLCAARALTPV